MIICIQYQKWLRTPSFHRKCFPLVAHTKNNVLAGFLKAKLNQTVSDVINVLKKQSYKSAYVKYKNIVFYHQQASKSVRRQNVVKYSWSLHALLNRKTRCETSNNKRICSLVHSNLTTFIFITISILASTPGVNPSVPPTVHLGPV